MRRKIFPYGSLFNFEKYGKIMYLRLGTDFIANILTGLLIGYWLDRWLNTSPICIILFIILGFFAGCRTIFKAIELSKTETEKKSDQEDRNSDTL